MQTLIKYISQFLLIPLIKELAEYLMKHFRERQEMKRLEQENKEKVKEYEESTSVDDARNRFTRLP
jgi:hypothetical protein